MSMPTLICTYDTSTSLQITQLPSNPSLTLNHILPNNTPMKEWSCTPKTGRYAPANHIGPSLTFPTPTLKYIRKLNHKNQRELFGRFCLCFKLVRGEIKCPCGEAEIETQEHILCHCPQCTHAHNNLQRISRDIFPPEILGTEPSIKALIDFLSLSGAFSCTGQEPRKPDPPNFDDKPVLDSENDESDKDL
ncbi:hypothetical protein CVT25_003591 [Psilocybe cyanescens]|uniref:Uncharacterized protein n=1 Tax=Psilocybe cyanescens TaxID=93625 RepID=A0A409XQS0_PSICY|nr:hypothetical protein CVT25_003591 [Psilocybe cyanescens]